MSTLIDHINLHILGSERKNEAGGGDSRGEGVHVGFREKTANYLTLDGLIGAIG